MLSCAPKDSGLKNLGIFTLGRHAVEVFYDKTSYDGSVSCQHDVIEMVIGIAHDNWWQSLSVAMHEAYELAMMLNNCRFVPDCSYSDTADEFVFHFTHPQFGEITAQAACFLSAVIPLLAAKYNERFAKKKRRKKRVTKSKGK